MGDIYFDLANFASHHRFDDEQARVLLECYFGATQSVISTDLCEKPRAATPRFLAPLEMPSRQFARLQLMRAYVRSPRGDDGRLTIGLSKLDFIFADMPTCGLGAQLNSYKIPDWGKWLKEITHG